MSQPAKPRPLGGLPPAERLLRGGPAQVAADLYGRFTVPVVRRIESEANLAPSDIGPLATAVRLNTKFPAITGVTPEDVIKIAGNEDAWELRTRCLATLLAIPAFCERVVEYSRDRREQEKFRSPEQRWRRACEGEARFTEFMLLPEGDDAADPIGPEQVLASLFLALHGPDDCRVEHCGLLTVVRLPQGDERVSSLRTEWWSHLEGGTVPPKPECLLLQGAQA